MGYDYEQLNDTELVTLANRSRIEGAHRGVPRHVLIEALKAFEHVEIEDPISRIRVRINDWVTRPEVWGRMQSGLPYGDKLATGFKGCPDCKNCPATMAVDCWLDNQHQIT